ncbi:MAG: pirin family protein [Hyphomonadaceae bacterium]|nr:pirin family protein [Hyphomonadaceae bacterium]
MSNTPSSNDDEMTSISPACKQIELIITPRMRDLDGGMTVRRVLPFHKKRMVGPFIFFDHFGPAVYAPGEGLDVRSHPHIGLSTVTYLFDGAIAHKDTVGNDLVIRPGAVNWMTAGKGIVHSERTPPEERAQGQTMHGIQVWVALPVAHEETEPAFIHHPASTLPVFELGGAQMRLIAGKAWGHASPVSFPHPIWYLAGEAPDGASFEIPANAAPERAVYVAKGKIQVGTEHLEEGAMAVLAADCDVPIVAEPGALFMLAGGAELPEKRTIYWNLVSSDTARIEQAKTDWQTSIDGGFDGTPFTLPEGETDWIPLPD